MGVWPQVVDTHTQRQIHLFRITSQIARITSISPSGLPAAVHIHSLVVPAETFRQVPRLPNHRYPLPACSAGSTTTSAVTWPSGGDARCRLSSAVTGPRLCYLCQITHIFRVEVFGAPLLDPMLEPYSRQLFDLPPRGQSFHNPRPRTPAPSQPVGQSRHRGWKSCHPGARYRREPLDAGHEWGSVLYKASCASSRAACPPVLSASSTPLCGSAPA
jgi:hypothetical protein